MCVLHLEYKIAHDGQFYETSKERNHSSFLKMMESSLHQNIADNVKLYIFSIDDINGMEWIEAIKAGLMKGKKLQM